MTSKAELQFAASRDPEATFCLQLEYILRTCATGRDAASPRDWQRQPFRPLLLGYTGKGNVGADVRVREIVRQMRVLFSHVGFDPQLVVMGQVSIDPVLDSLGRVELTTYFPDFIEAQMARVDGVIACEGSMFTSKFSDLLSATFAGAIGYAVRKGKLAMGYGAESGRMSARLSDFVRRSCRGGLILSRSQQTHEQLASLGLETQLGADPAWTYDPPGAALAAARGRLSAHGWDGRQPIAVVCPMNPFCWPVKVDFEKARGLREHGTFKDLHYDGVLFHSAPESAEADFARYLDALRTVVDHLRGRGYFPILIGMEKLDGRSCARLGALLRHPVPVFVSGENSAEAIVSLLHGADLVVTSRFHACVLALNAQVKTIGIALDERIHNLFSENGLAPWFFRCDADRLGERLAGAIDRLGETDLDETYTTLARTQIRRFGTMGMRLHDEVRRVYPDFPAAGLPRHWKAFLPPLSPRLEALLQEPA